MHKVEGRRGNEGAKRTEESNEKEALELQGIFVYNYSGRSNNKH